MRKMKKRHKEPAVKRMPYNTKEKIVLILFLIFVVVAIMILFRESPTPKMPVTGVATLTSELARSSYNRSSNFNGSVKLMLQPGDLLPPNTEINFLVYTNKPKCSKYLCDNNQEISWFIYNETLGECVVNRADPEGICCQMMGPQCRQIIINSGFEDIWGSLPRSWTPSVVGMAGNAFGIEEYWMDPLGQVTSIVAFTDSNSIQMTQGYAAFYQDLTARASPISAFRKGYIPERKATYSSSGSNFETENELNFDGLSFQGILLSDPLQWKLNWYKYDLGCAFELVIKSNSGKKLHYYYPIDNACSFTAIYPNYNPNIDAFIPKTLPTISNWSNESADLYSDWIAQGWPENDLVKEIWIISHGKPSTTWPYAQIVRWDDIKLTKTTTGVTPSDLCEARGKKCCAEGTGLGSYFEQFECPEEGDECWSSCAANLPLTLATFVRESTSDNKRNITSGFFQYIKNPSEWSDEDTQSGRCKDSICTLFDFGSGYAACLDTSSNAPSSCKNWDNIYELFLDDLTHFKTPGENGTYDLVVKIQYKPTNKYCGTIQDPQTGEWITLETCTMYEVKQSFRVGEVCEPVWQCTEWLPYPCTDKQTRNCTDTTCGLGTKTEERACCVENWSCGSWGDCVDSYRTRTCVDLNNCSTTHILNDTWYDPICAALPPCTADDWSCTQWQPTICPETGIQYRTCDLIGTCDPQDPSSYIPVEEKTCIPPEPEKPALGWLIYVLIGVILLAAIIFIVKQFILPKAGKKPKAKESYPELTSYIRDALATGATRAEIKAKLKGAGWPENSINAAFKAIK
ncbi:MAG: hypothetical protein IB618_01165 [Candidatus Pacearchaeota archaeon]|nr:MAG: hypothetical protein IB618_01165 [Candidatus Pacearchaeota archaeon]